MKYTVDHLNANILVQDIDHTVYLFDGNRVALVPDCCGSSYYHVIVNGKTIATRCTFYNGQRKALVYLNAR